MRRVWRFDRRAPRTRAEKDARDVKVIKGALLALPIITFVMLTWALMLKTNYPHIEIVSYDMRHE